eukprot:scaffold343518_cov63-Attheya_sp.AAC.1
MTDMDGLFNFTTRMSVFGRMVSNCLGRQVVQNAGKLNISSGPTSDRHTALQTNGLPHTVRTNTNTRKPWYNKYTITAASHTLSQTVPT